MSDFSIFWIAVIFVAINGLTQLAWAAQLGFKLKPTAFAYFFGAVANLLTGNVVPISGQSATLTISTFQKNVNERVASILISSVVMIVLGFFGVVSNLVDFAGPPVILGMIAGVGILVSQISFTMLQQEKRTGIISFVAALLVFWLFVGNPHQLVYVVGLSVLIASLDFALLQKRTVQLNKLSEYKCDDGSQVTESDEWRAWKKEYWQEFKIMKPKFTPSSIYYAFSFMCIILGTNIAFGRITAGMTGGRHPLNVDHLTIISNMADFFSALFGGVPLEPIISATAASPLPILAGSVMMALCGILLLFNIIKRIVTYVPAQSIAGFLFIIGFFATFRPNLMNAINTGYPTQALLALLVTVMTKNPFLGLVAGILVRYIGVHFGLPA